LVVICSRLNPAPNRFRPNKHQTRLGRLGREQRPDATRKSDRVHQGGKRGSACPEPAAVLLRTSPAADQRQSRTVRQNHRHPPHDRHRGGPRLPTPTDTDRRV